MLLQGADQGPSIGQELTNQLKTPLYKQLIGNTPMVDLSSLSANPQVSSQALLASPAPCQRQPGSSRVISAHLKACC